MKNLCGAQRSEFAACHTCTWHFSVRGKSRFLSGSFTDFQALPGGY